MRNLDFSRHLAATSLLFAFTSACSAGRQDGDGLDTTSAEDSGTQQTSATADTTTTATDTVESTSDSVESTTATDSEIDETLDNQKFDLEIPDSSDNQLSGCQKVDFLFVVDNSASMADEQKHLVDSFPGFIAGIQETLDVDDYHVLVADTDMSTINAQSTMGKDGTCAPDPGCCLSICDHLGLETCNDKTCSDIVDAADCSLTLGAGQLASGKGLDCQIANGLRYMTKEQPDLPAAFACAATVGTSGDPNERSMNALGNAVSAALNGTGGCNEGFLRDDALLVATLITDEEDLGKSPGSPQDWYDAIVTAKNGDPAAAVVIGIVGDGDVAGSVCAGSNNQAEPSPNLRKFVELFGKNGQTVSICSPDYTQEFKDIVAVINAACEDFIPPK